MLDSPKVPPAGLRDAARTSFIWIAAAAAALVTEPARLDDLALFAAVGTLAGMSRRTWALAFPVAAAAVLDPSILPWAIAAVAICIRTTAGADSQRPESEPQRQLMRSRRRDEPAAVVVMRAQPPTRRAGGALRSALRSTDGSELVLEGEVVELRAVLDDADVDRRAFEARMSEALGTADARFGWAGFPADGVTLDVLFEAPKRDLSTEPLTADLPAQADPQPALARTATAVAEVR